MTLPPLANVLAVRSADPRLLDWVDRVVRHTSPGRSVRRPNPKWLVVVEEVPPSKNAIDESPETFFTEGHDIFTRDGADASGEILSKGPSSLSRFEGDFGFLHVGDEDRATFVRSCGGRVPVYIRRGRSYVAFATRLADLISFTPDDVVLDPLPLALWTLAIALLPDDRTFFQGISSVPRGHVVTMTGDNRIRVDRYWDPRPDFLPEPSETQRREHVERCRTILVEHLSQELDPNGFNLLTLSGGVDSSSLAALAAGTLGYPVGTLSLLPREEPHRSHELSYIENLRSEYEFKKTWEYPLDFSGRIDAVNSAPAVGLPVVHPALGLLPRLVGEQPMTVLFGGEFADEVCGSRFTFPDWIRHASPVQLVRWRRDWPQGLRTLPRWIKHRSLRLARRPFLPSGYSELPDFVREEVREDFREWRARRRRALAADDRPNPYLAFQAELDGFVSLNWEVTTALGVRRAWPFFNRAMLELASECHPTERVGRETKRLLRAALSEDVPTMNLRRQTPGHWRHVVDRRLAPPAVPEVADVFELDRLPAEEAEIGLPVSWFVRRFADSVEELRPPAGFATGLPR